MNSLPFLSSNLASLVGIADGVYAVLDAWNEAPSGYVITVRAQSIDSAQSFFLSRGEWIPDNTVKIAVGDIVRCDYFARGFGLLHAISAVCSEPDAIGNEDALGLGLLNG